MATSASRVKHLVAPMSDFEEGDDVESFISSLDFARNLLLDGDERLFLRYCLTKLGPKARTMVRSVFWEINTVEDLIFKLRLAYGSRENLRQILAKMTGLYQYTDESVTEYAGRFRSLLLKARNKFESCAGENSGITMNGIVQSARESFIAGLKNGIKRGFINTVSLTFDDAVNVARLYEHCEKETDDFDSLRGEESNREGENEQLE